MKSLTNFINEGHGRNREYKISYGTFDGEDGIVFRQRINITMSEKDLTEFNNRMKDMARSRVRYEGIYKELVPGENQTTIGTCREFCNFFNITNDKRLRDENTIVNIVIQ